MKKILFSVLAVAALASCTNDQTIATPKGEAIAFDKVWVDNATRATDLNANTLQDFGVYASVKTTATEGLIMNNVPVTKQASGAYTYENTQYWVPNTTYSFAAIAPKTDARWAYTTDGSVAHAGTISFDNAAAGANQDLIYAFESRELAADALTSAPSAVGFTFNHMLARVRFTFVNSIAAGSNITMKISNVKVADAYANGTLAVEDGEPAADWVAANKTLEVAFANAGAVLAGNGGSETTEHHYLIPAYDTYTINFDVTVYQAGVELDTYARTATVRLDMQKGNSYDIKAALTTETVIPNPLFPIEFTVTKVEDWSNYTKVEAAVVEEVATADELVAAIAAGSNVVLTQDINLDEQTVYTRAAEAGLVLNNDVVIDGAGHTLSTSAVRAIQAIGAKKITVRNLTLNAGGERGIQLQGENQTLIVENVKATAKNYTLNFTSSCQNATVVVNDSELKGLNVVNVWAANSNITINNTTLTCEDNATEGYAVVCNNGENTTVTVNGGKVVICGSNAEDTYAGLQATPTAVVKFVGTECEGGNLEVEGHVCAINYGEYRYTFGTVAEAVEYAQDGETIVLINNVTLESPVHVSKNIAFDLNGKNISIEREGKEQNYVFAVFEGGNLTINGEGNVHAGEATYSIAVWAYGGDVTINGGNYTNAGEGSDLILSDKGSVVTINGGTFKAAEIQEGVDSTNEKYSALNCVDKTGSSFVVKGGKFYMFDPANNASESPAVSFVAEGYESVPEGEWFVVKAI